MMRKNQANPPIFLGICQALMLLLIFSLVAPTAIAAKKTTKTKKQYPNGCYLEGYSIKHFVLNLHPNVAGKSQSMYFIHNRSMNQSIRLFQMRTGNEPYVMYLNNTIRPNQWGVFATDEKNTKFICTKATKKSKRGRVVDCKDYLKVCEFTNVKFSLNNGGNYWVVSSTGMRAAVRSAIYQGSLLKW